MARPAKLPEWATSGANIVEPSSGKKLAGWLNGEQPPAPFFNWFSNLAFQWLTWLAGSREAQELSALLNPTSITPGVAAAIGGFACNDAGLIVAVGASGKIATSTNFGGTWTIRTPAASYANTFTDVIWTGTTFVAVGYVGEIQTSPDGITWTHRTSGISNVIFGVARSAAGVIIATSGPDVIKSINDGATWTALTQLNGGTFNSGRVIESGGVFLIWGNSGLPDATINVWRSTGNAVAAINLVALLGAGPSGSYVVEFAVRPGGGFIARAVKSDNSAMVLISDDGITWTVALGATPILGFVLSAFNGIAVLVPANGTGLGYASADRGASWRLQWFRGVVQNSRVQGLETVGARFWLSAGSGGDAGKAGISPLWAAF
jgi:hypothetical protein